MEKAPPTKRPRYDAAFRAEALRLATESRSTLADARALNIDPKQLVLVGWIADAFKTTDLNISDSIYVSTPPFLASTRAELLAHFEVLSVAARNTLVAADDEAMAQPWTMRRDEVVLVPPQPRTEIVRHLISHMVHHRGQLMVYLRLLDVPVPRVYGPSADE